MEWGICTTAKAPLQEILAFIAWHKHLGASHIWVHLDDADLAKGEILNGIDGVTAVLCDADYWARNKKGRPDAHQARQSYNMRQVYKLNALPCIAHIDVDEYLYPHRDLDEILTGWDSGPLLRAAPAEALHDPSLPDDIFTARQFRRPFPKDLPAQARQEILGEYEGIIPKNILSHSVGKAFFRTGIPRLRPRIHGAFVDQKRLKAPFHPDLTVLHFHAQNKEEWVANLHRRATRGAYRSNEVLVAFAEHATPEEVEAFYTATQTATPTLLAALEAHGLLFEADLQLKSKVAELF